MRTHDALLRHLLGVVDRALVWAVLAIMLSALTWTAAWESGVGVWAAADLVLPPDAQGPGDRGSLTPSQIARRPRVARLTSSPISTRR